MAILTTNWIFWALWSAVFAALTAIFAKVGVTGVNTNLATLIRTVVVVLALVPLVWATGEAKEFASISGKTGAFLVLSGLATGASWLCYFTALKLGQASQVAPVDKLSVVLVAIFAALFLGESLSATGWSGIALITAGVVLVAVS